MQSNGNDISKKIITKQSVGKRNDNAFQSKALYHVENFALSIVLEGSMPWFLTISF